MTAMNEVLFSHEDDHIRIVVASVYQQIVLSVQNRRTGRVLARELPAVQVEPIVLRGITTESVSADFSVAGLETTAR